MRSRRGLVLYSGKAVTRWARHVRQGYRAINSALRKVAHLWTDPWGLTLSLQSARLNSSVAAASIRVGPLDPFHDCAVFPCENGFVGALGSQPAAGRCLGVVTELFALVVAVRELVNEEYGFHRTPCIRYFRQNWFQTLGWDKKPDEDVA